MWTIRLGTWKIIFISKGLERPNISSDLELLNPFTILWTSWILADVQLRGVVPVCFISDDLKMSKEVVLEYCHVLGFCCY